MSKQKFYFDASSLLGFRLGAMHPDSETENTTSCDKGFATKGATVVREGEWEISDKMGPKVGKGGGCGV